MNELLRIYDNTRVSDHRTCNRKHFFRHELHLTGGGASAALSFGLAWHKAQDVIWGRIGDLSKIRQMDETIALAKLAYAAWEDCWAGCQRFLAAENPFGGLVRLLERSVLPPGRL